MDSNYIELNMNPPSPSSKSDNDSKVELTPINAETNPISTPLTNTTNNNNTPSPSSSTTTWHRMKYIAYLSSHILSVVAILLTIIWIHQDKMGGGGLAWTYGKSGQTFNWHPLLMICSFGFMSIASLLFRVPPSTTFVSSSLSSPNSAYASIHADSSSSEYGSMLTRGQRKFLHVLCWTISLVCGIIGMMAVLRSHNDPINGYIANLYSFHSWMGCFVMGLFVLQFCLGLYWFVLKRWWCVPSCIQKWKNSQLCSCWKSISNRRIMWYHKNKGVLIYCMATITILLGIMEKEGFVGCGYKLSDNDGPDLKPYQHWNEIPVVCKISHGLGFVVLVLALCTGYVLHGVPMMQYDNLQEEEEEVTAERTHGNISGNGLEGNLVV